MYSNYVRGKELYDRQSLSDPGDDHFDCLYYFLLTNNWPLLHEQPTPVVIISYIFVLGDSAVILDNSLSQRMMEGDDHVEHLLLGDLLLDYPQVDCIIDHGQSGTGHRGYRYVAKQSSADAILDIAAGEVQKVVIEYLQAFVYTVVDAMDPAIDLRHFLVAGENIQHHPFGFDEAYIKIFFAAEKVSHCGYDLVEEILQQDLEYILFVEEVFIEGTGPVP